MKLYKITCINKRKIYICAIWTVSTAIIIPELIYFFPQQHQITNGDGIEKPVIFIDGGIHAREWISPASIMYFIRQVGFNLVKR